MVFLRKENCFWLATNGGSDGTYNIAVAGCSKSTLVLTMQS